MSNPFIGIVEDVDDPLQLGRVRIRIINHNEVETKEELPWTIVLGPTTSMSIGGFGSSPTWMLIGTVVVGIFLDDKGSNPVILGTIYQIPGGEVSNHSVSALARGEELQALDKIGPEPDSAYAPKYPFNRVISTPSGHMIELDDTEGVERIRIYHKTGTYFEIGPDGTQVSKVTGNAFRIMSKDEEIFIQGKSNIVVEGDAKIEVKGKYDIDVAGDISIKAGGNLELSATRIDLNE